MINIEELRIGNLILIDQKLREVCSLQINHEADHGTRIGYANKKELQFEKETSERLQPVAITDQILQDFGFVFEDYFKVWQRKRPERTYSMELDRDYFPLDFARQPIVFNMRYVHQLQNLFLIIQGEHLRLPASSLI